MKKILSILFFIAGVISIIVDARGQAFADFETGAVFIGYNDVRIPGDTGTFFSLNEDLEAQPSPFVRLRAGYTINLRHNISVLYAPLLIKSEGIINKQIYFNGVSFSAGTSLDAEYMFNSYRLTYRYDIVLKPTIEFGLGFTAKIRDAKISLSDELITTAKTNVGFVPILNFRLHWLFNENAGVLLYGDALAAPQGRAEDVLLAFTYKLSDNLSIRGGYRILEGGADNDEVYNFALINYASIGLKYIF